MTSLALYILAGIAGATNMILWGIYGDLLMEPFDVKKVFRSFLLALFYSIFLWLLHNGLPLIVVTLNVVAFERITTEIYKAFFRRENQDKYAIPSDLNIHAPHVLKIIVGCLLLGSLLLLFSVFSFNRFHVPLLILSGFIPAIGGMLKDAPYEGFDLLKFFRSPVVALAAGLLIMFSFPQLELKYFLFAVWGAERIISECYKKIICGNVPGKFKQDQEHRINKRWKIKRKQVVLPLYWLSVLILVAIAVMSVYR